jgi:hypothetical protein
MSALQLALQLAAWQFRAACSFLRTAQHEASCSHLQEEQAV